MSYSILSRLLGHVSSEHLHFWLQGLRDFALAESHLSGSPRTVDSSNGSSRTLMDRLVLASKLYLQGLSSLKVIKRKDR